MNVLNGAHLGWFRTSKNIRSKQACNHRYRIYVCMCVTVAVDLKQALDSMRSRVLECVRMRFIMQCKNALHSQCCHRGCVLVDIAMLNFYGHVLCKSVVIIMVKRDRSSANRNFLEIHAEMQSETMCEGG